MDIRNSLANQLFVLIINYSKDSNSAFPYQIIIGSHVRYLPYDKGRAVEKLLDYISHREEIERYDD